MAKYTTLQKTVLDKNLRYEITQKNFWEIMAGMPKYNPVSNMWNLTGSIIENFVNFKKTGRNNLMVTMLRNVYGYGKSGKATLRGNEKPLDYAFMKLFVHNERQAIELPDDVDLETIAWVDIAKDYKPVVARWWGGYLNSEPTRAMLEGYSRGITLATASGGLGKTMRYHPNFLIWDSGGLWTTNEATFSYTSATYKSNLETALELLASGDTFKKLTLENLYSELKYREVEPLVIDKKDYYVMIVHSRQMATFRVDAETTVSNAGMRGSKNPIYNMADTVWGNFLLIVNDVVTRIAYVDDTNNILDFFEYSGGSLVGDATGTYEKPQLPGTNQHAACAIVLGQSAIAQGLYQDIVFAKESDDYGMVQGLAAKRYYGFARMDFYDEEVDGSTTPTAHVKPQSAIVVTYV